jgi:hypothetical protein
MFAKVIMATTTANIAGAAYSRFGCAHRHSVAANFSGELEAFWAILKHFNA